MRHWLLLVLILITPLRGLAADAMGIAMAGVQGAPALHSMVMAPVDMASQDDDKPHCAEQHTAAAPAATGLDATDAHHHGAAGAGDERCPTCASCMVCASAALAVLAQPAAVAALHHGLPGIGSILFRSAAALPGFKPPIS